MKVQEQKTLGLVAQIEVPSTVAEFDKLAKREGACLEEAVNNIIYRGVLASLRDVFLHGQEADKTTGTAEFKGIEQTTKVARKTKTTGRKDKDGADILTYGETEAEYFDAVCAKLNKKPADFQDLMTAAAKLVKFDPSEREKKPTGPKKLAEKYANTARAILKGKNLNRFVKDAAEALGRKWVASGDEAKDVESLGWVVKEYSAWREAQTLESLVG